MRFEARHHITGTVEEVEQALLDDRYHAFLLAHHGVLLEVEPLERKVEGERVRRKVRYRPKPVISAIGPKPVPPDWFAFIESSTYDRRRKEMSFSNVPTHRKISDLLVNTGILRFRAAGSQTERTLEGEISLKLPFLLKPLGMIGERVIQAEGLKLLEAEVPVLNRFIAEVLHT